MLARTSKTPGRTKQLIFFNLANRLQLVDLPGYGYASASKTDIQAWTNLTHRYLAGRPSLQRVFLLIDCRRGIGSADQDIMNLLDKAAVSWAVVITKADKQTATALAKVCKETRDKIGKYLASYPKLFITSSESGIGIDSLRAHLARFGLPKEDHAV